jgi:hypothetical protein
MNATMPGESISENHLIPVTPGSNFLPGESGDSFSNPKREKFFFSKRSDMQINSEQDKYREKNHLIHLRFKSAFGDSPSGGFPCVS